jgi:signal recognition particle receptor subunit beta
MDFVRAVNESDGAHRYAPEEVRAAIDLAPEVPVLGCDARVAGSGIQTRLTLVRHVLCLSASRATAPGQDTRS